MLIVTSFLTCKICFCCAYVRQGGCSGGAASSQARQDDDCDGGGGGGGADDALCDPMSVGGQLDALRRQVAAENNLVPESVLTLGAIYALCDKRPATSADVVAIVGDARVRVILSQQELSCLSSLLLLRCYFPVRSRRYPFIS